MSAASRVLWSWFWLFNDIHWTNPGNWVVSRCECAVANAIHSRWITIRLIRKRPTLMVCVYAWHFFHSRWITINPKKTDVNGVLHACHFFQRRWGMGSFLIFLFLNIWVVFLGLARVGRLLVEINCCCTDRNLHVSSVEKFLGDPISLCDTRKYQSNCDKWVNLC